VRRLCGGFLALWLLSVPAVRAQEGKLERIREETSEPSHAQPADRKSNGCDDDNPLGFLYGEVMLAAFAAPFVLPHLALGDDLNDDGCFPRAPYADGQPGYMRLHFSESQDWAKAWEAGVLKGWAVRLALEDGNDFHGLNRVGGQFLVEGKRLGLQGSGNWLTEGLTASRHDDMFLGDVNVVFRFAQHELVQMRSGLGVRFSADSSTSHAGFNFTYGADFYPVQPLVLSAQLDAGTLGSAWLFHTRVSAGLLWHNWETFVGYDYLRIGSVDLQGPLLGVRLWF
jgi:hypothetical protein